MLKVYRIGGLTYQFEEGKQPSGAAEVTETETVKSVKPANKAVKPVNKSARGARK